MTIEQRLKEEILTQYKSIRAFTIAIDVPYSTIDTMLKNGISGTGIATVLRVCLGLGIDIEGLFEDKIRKKVQSSGNSFFSQEEFDLVAAYRQANADDKTIVDAALRKYINTPTLTLVAARDGGLSTASAEAVNQLGLEMHEDDADL